MNKMDETLAMTTGKADMRGIINTFGIEIAAETIADAWAPPFDIDGHARLQGIILAAFEAGMLHQLNRGTRNA